MLASSTAYAQTESVDVVRAREQFAGALKAEDAGRWEEARALFEQVAKVRETPQVRYHVATCLERLDRLVEAAREYDRAERTAQTSTDPGRRSSPREQASAPRRCARERLASCSIATTRP